MCAYCKIYKYYFVVKNHIKVKNHIFLNQEEKQFEDYDVRPAYERFNKQIDRKINKHR